MTPHMTICDVCDKQSYVPNEVHFCPLHEWAHKLLAACEAALPAIRWGMTHQPGNTSQWLAVETLLLDAIAKASGG